MARPLLLSMTRSLTLFTPNGVLRFCWVIVFLSANVTRHPPSHQGHTYRLLGFTHRPPLVPGTFTQSLEIFWVVVLCLFPRSVFSYLLEVTGTLLNIVAFQ
jgi:hypothetical protein